MNFWEPIFATTVIYFFLLVGLRVFARRVMAQLDALGLLIMLLLGSAVETSLIGRKPGSEASPFHDPNTALWAGLVSAATLFLLNFAVNRSFRRWPKLWSFVTPKRLLLVWRGQIVEENVKRAGLTYPDLCQALRRQGAEKEADVEVAVMEQSGEIDVVLRSAPSQ